MLTVCQALGSGSQPWLHVRLTLGILKNPSARLPPPLDQFHQDLVGVGLSVLRSPM